MNRTTWLQDRRMQKFRDVLSRWERKELSAMEAGELLGCSERQFRRYRRRYEEDGFGGLADRRFGKASMRRVPVDKLVWMLGEYRTHHLGWNVKHFHEHIRQQHGFRWGYTWTKTQLHTAGLVERAARRGAHRRKRPRKPCEGMMLHQDGSRFAWLSGAPELDLIVTMDDATSTIYSAFLVEEEGTVSTFRGLLEVFTAQGLPASLYTDRGSHYFYTPKAGEAVDKSRPTQVGRALNRLGIEHIAAYSPEARGRSERMFGTLQDRLPKELKLAGIYEIEAANRFIREVFLPAHNARFAKPPEVAESGFVAADAAMLAEILCIEVERVVGRDNTVSHSGRRLQLPASPLRAHYVKASVKVREYPDGTLAVFHGPRRIAGYDAEGSELLVPTASSLTPCSPPSRRGLAAAEFAASASRRPALTSAARGVPAPARVGTKKRALGSNKETDRKGTGAHDVSPSLMQVAPAGVSTASKPAQGRSHREADN
jgi:transposase